MAKEMKVCINEFLEHVKQLEGEDDPDGCGFHREYRMIHELQIKNRRQNVFKLEAGKEEHNLKKNRYKDILPYDEHRVALSTKDEDESGSDYINASLLMGVKGSGGYIATQGPLASTVNDFWRLIWEKEIEIIFMACRIVELGKIKCKQYWNDLDASDEFGDITVYTEMAEIISSDFVQRKFRVTRGDSERTVMQYHYSGWPDHGIPDKPAHIRDLIAIMRKSRTKIAVPLLVHCSAGCGRTGAIAAIDYVWTLLEEGKLDENFSLYELICKFREQRMSIVQTPDQYALVYRVLKSLCEDWLVKMASHTYVNVELEQDYVNIDDVTTSKEEEHVYEDSTSLAESLNKLKAADEATQNEQKQTVSPPESPNSKKSSPRSSEYVNVEISNGKPKVTDSAPEEDTVRHKTVIQIGAAKNTPSSSGKETTLANSSSSPPPTTPHPDCLSSASHSLTDEPNPCNNISTTAASTSTIAASPTTTTTTTTTSPSSPASSNQSTTTTTTNPPPLPPTANNNYNNNNASGLSSNSGHESKQLSGKTGATALKEKKTSNSRDMDPPFILPTELITRL